MVEFELFSDVSYGAHERHKFDIFIPEDVKKKSGAILFIHGGGWHDGDKSVHHKDCRYFCNLGYICATMNYRFVTDELTIFNELDDITCTIKKLKEFLSAKGYDVKNLILSGGSAGAHLSLMYAYTRVDEAPVNLAAVCAYCPPVNFAKPDFLVGLANEFEEWKYGLLSKCCGFTITKETLMNEPQQKVLYNASPEKYLSPDCIPTAIFYGKSDDLIPSPHIEEFIRLLNENNIKNDVLLYENSGHALDKDPETAQQAKDIIEKYAKMYL